MKSFGSYFRPAPKKGEVEEDRKSSSLEMKTSPLSPGASTSALGTPRTLGSRPTSIYPSGDFRNGPSNDILEIKCDVMVNWLHQQQLEAMWTNGGVGEGVVLKKIKDQYTSCPQELQQTQGDLFDAVRALNVKVAMTVNTRVIKVFLRSQELAYVPLADGLRLQILPNITYLPSCLKHHFAAFIQDSSILVVWDDEPKHLLVRAKKIEAQLMAMIWKPENYQLDEKTNKPQSVLVTEIPFNGSENGIVDGEEQKEKPRKLILIQAVLCALTLALLVAAIGSGWRQIAIEVAVDKQMLRLAFAAVVPFQCWLALFFMQSIVGCFAQILGPISQMNENSKFYSGIPPVRLRSGRLPHVTIQCPVYKEGLHSVIEPTIMSLKAAISTYELQGGTANIFVNDDGMQIISPADGEARRDFYEEHNIGWVARPKHNPKPAEGEVAFIRAGKFKKASNMNYALAVSARVEDKLSSINRPPHWSQEHEADVYAGCLQEVTNEDQERTWADGNVRIGDYILLIDSDTRVPEDCLLDAVSEMEQSPQVAIIQFSSGVMNVTESFFENGITFFTNLIYTAISFAVACGDVAPFVGHNAILRWSAVQDIAYTGDDGSEKYWSESTVSEDFDMALRLQTAGYIIRFASYLGDGFKEGVSLTVYDELARWEKYAYGCNELIFHPIRYWPMRGPFTKLFRNFICSNMPLPSKFTIMAYIGTYYAIASAWILTLMNYFVIGWFNGWIDHYYIDSFKIFFSIIVVFTALGNLALAILRYRYADRSLFGAIWENFKWVFLLAIFLGGVSLHVSQAILSHMFSIDMSWGATAKEVENTTFFKEIPKLLKKFKFMFAFVLICTGGIVCMALIAPPFWRIDTFVAIFPIANVLFSHFMLPIALNPNLMLFTW
ncbi:hypothetical protein MMC30_001763 [Trapelia coarctata]|nr:hypothetical protein [Trapelia coarctata]